MARAFTVALLAAPAAAYLKTSSEDLDANPAYSFADYVGEYGKQYDAAEYVHREAIFKRNLAVIRAHNADSTQTFRMGLNRFADWNTDEMQKMKGLNKGMLFGSSSAQGTLSKARVADLPASKDWRDDNVVTPVKDQGSCGSCWAHSVTEGVESAAAIASGKLQVLAVEQLVSCCPAPDECGGTGGCGGLNTWLGYQCVVDSGMSLNKNWKYTGKAQKCDQDKVKAAVVKIANYTRVPANDYASLLNAVATIGPVSVSLNAGGLKWQLYEKGVFSDKCGLPDKVNIDHSIQLVGYGTDTAAGKDYWLVRNSWGTGFGEKGYIRLERFGDGKEPCGVDDEKKTHHVHLCKSDNRTSFPTCGTCGIMCDAAYATGAHVV